MLSATIDRYRGVEVSADGLPKSAETFHAYLTQSIEAWRACNFERVWLRIPVDKSAFIPIAVAMGFAYHQVLGTELMLVKPLVDGTFIPTAATHYIGAGGVVINERDEILTIVEQTASRPDYFKLPGGMLDPDEHLEDGIVREVLEETGIQTAFESVVFLRHTHQTPYFGKSNWYVICRLRPLSAEITLDPAEIALCQWMPLDRYLSNPAVADFNKLIVRTAVGSPGLEKHWLPNYERQQPLTELFMPKRMLDSAEMKQANHS